MTDNSKIIYVIDDSETVLKKTKSFLKDTDYEVYYFTNPMEALDKMKDVSPHLILLDYFMNEMNGDEFMIKVSERLLHYHDWQVYLISSHKFTQEEQLSMLTLGITEVLEKPLERDKLLNAIDKINH